ncbi:hypothetical protein G6O69_16750 [Pseudenhygromyxa sp. WMMC2535]|uniref:hypothetical protein n=1 Tax=Pseudenhygromyxa sp. WMMC2535 TaxID=2712867 RepID=UPI001557113B|nr:hypothetical protein [Pseudenhygromyxa sp. WMMC2535]NVB39494.1 hypothetical protein [Pseudenhygromyxa sp. WMMC2535]
MALAKLDLRASTPAATIAAHFAANGTLLAYAIPPEVPREELEALARAHASFEHAVPVFDLVIAHPACDPALLDLLLELGGASSEVANSVLTSGKATPAQIEALRRSTSPSVREHAEMAALELALREGPVEDFADILARYRDHETLGYAVRHRLATHPRTPVEVLRTIASFDDETGARARARLED